MKKTLISLTMLAAMLLPIYAQEAPAAPEKEGRIQRRKENQQGRIAQGVSSGQLTAGETANLEHKEARLNREVHNDRTSNGGTLTPQERRQVNRQQNRLSKNIYRDKHNGTTQQK